MRCVSEAVSASKELIAAVEGRLRKKCFERPSKDLPGPGKSIPPPGNRCFSKTNHRSLGHIGTKTFQEEHHLLRKTLGELSSRKSFPKHPKWEKEGLVPKKCGSTQERWAGSADRKAGIRGARCGIAASVVIAEELAALRDTWVFYLAPQ